jgi:microcystin-dependent protein
MPADTNSPLLQLLLQGTANNNNAWGDNANNFVFLLLEQAVAGGLTISGSGTYPLTATESRNAHLIVQGTISTIVVPAISKRWRFYNQTSGPIVVKTASQTPGVNLPLNKTTDCFFDVANSVVRRTDAEKVGEYFFHAGQTAPPGSLECVGGTQLIASYPDLFAQLGTTYGGNGTTTFGIPQGADTGRFLRSRYSGVGSGVSQANQNLSHTHAGASFSGTTTGQSVNHSHTGSGTTSGVSVFHTHNIIGVVDLNGAGSGVGGGGSFLASSRNFTSTGDSVDHSHTYSFTTSGYSVDHSHVYSGTTSTIPAAGGNESRPESLVGVLCIRY